MTRDDVIVVGAGLSGLVAGVELQRAGLSVIVLEAADHCGGRAHSETSVLGSHLDLGGQWIGHDHHRLAALSDELGATRFAMHTGRAPAMFDGSRRLHPWTPCVVVAIAALILLDVVRRVRRPDRWGSTSVQAWIDKVPGRARRLLEVAALISWTTNLERMSVRTMMSLIGAQGGLVHMLSTKGGAQEGLIVEGVGHLVDRLAEELGDAIHTDHAVTRIVRGADGVVVETPEGTFASGRVIVTVPPPIASRITHEPELPQDRRALQDETVMGSVYKAVAIYSEPFWRADASGELVVLDRPGCAWFDTSPPGGPGHLCVLVGGPEARTLDDLSPQDRREQLLCRLASHLGPAVATPVDWHEKAWHLDPHVGGGYVASPTLGARHAEWPFPAEPIGRVHWAGAETATEHPGYLDGAIEAGRRASREILDAESPGRVSRPG